MEPDLHRALQRVPLLIALFGLIGSAVAWRYGGFSGAVAFLVGAVAAFFNFRLIERFVARLVGAMAENPAKRPRFAGLRLFLQLALFLAGTFVILRFTGFSMVVAVYGFLVCPAAVMIEAIYYLILTYGHT
jgi:hypothetical protein